MGKGTKHNSYQKMITAIVIAKNEEENIVDCLETLSFCDEVLVLDDNSQDRTAELSIKLGAKVISRKLDNNFSEQRNHAQSVAKNDWVLFIDADERVSRGLAEEIQTKIQDLSVDGYYIPREDLLFGKILRHGELQGKKFLRLGRKGYGKWIGRVHETWNIKGETGNLQNPILHIPHKTISEFLSEINHYTTIRARELHEEKKSATIASIILYTKGKFIYTYILKQGFLDGIPGLALSLMMSFHSFLVRGKLYLLSKNK